VGAPRSPSNVETQQRPYCLHTLPATRWQSASFPPTQLNLSF
jgi:hypothetical protein